MSVEFKAWEKIPRDSGEGVVISEKLDGTNACVIIEDGKVVGVQSRKRLITPEDDNYSFAQWCSDNNEGLMELGDGYHYGEWYGPGIQKNPAGLDAKKFFLFNAGRWSNGRPDCCEIVDVLYAGKYSAEIVDETMAKLREDKPHSEGIVCWYVKTRRYTKRTFAYEKGKWDKK